MVISREPSRRRVVVSGAVGISRSVLHMERDKRKGGTTRFLWSALRDYDPRRLFIPGRKVRFYVLTCEIARVVYVVQAGPQGLSVTLMATHNTRFFSYFCS